MTHLETGRFTEHSAQELNLAAQGRSAQLWHMRSVTPCRQAQETHTTHSGNDTG